MIMEQMTTHEEQLEYLRKAEGQIRGIQKMIEEKRYCVDIITQIHSVIGALSSIENKILKNHLQGCVTSCLQFGTEDEKQKKIDEIMEIVSRFVRIS